MTIVIGDTHGQAKNLTRYVHETVQREDDETETKMVSKEDITHVIVAGDFGMLWHNEDSPSHFTDVIKLQMLYEMPYEIVVVLGNHENYTEIEKLPKVERYGNPVWQVGPNVFILQNGYDYTIDGHHILAFGGADSIDKEYRSQGDTWWPQEIPTQEQFDRCLETIKKSDGKFDYVITHTIDDRVVDELRYHMPVWTGEKAYREAGGDPTGHMIARFADKIECKAWIFGHFHVDRIIDVEDRNHPYVCLINKAFTFHK